MFKEYQLHTPGDEEDLACSGITFAERLDSVASAGGFTVAQVVQPLNGASCKITTEPIPVDTGKPYMGRIDYRGVVH